MRTTISGSADKGSKQFGALLGSETANATRLRDRRTLHDAFGLHFANRRQRAYEIVGAHLCDALLVRREGEEFVEREFTRLHEPLHFSATTSIRDGQARRFDTLFLRQCGRSRCHEVRLLR